jgi:GNAT superfamily N-acetyltransferase
MSDLSISVTADPSTGELESIAGNLTAFNEAEVGPADRQPLAVLVRDAEGTLVAGISGNTSWGWLYVQLLYVAESQRGRHLAERMLEAAEAEALKRNCHGAYIDTFNPTALKVYKRTGYVPFGVLKDFPEGRVRTFLQKRL